MPYWVLLTTRQLLAVKPNYVYPVLLSAHTGVHRDTTLKELAEDLISRTHESALQAAQKNRAGLCLLFGRLVTGVWPEGRGLSPRSVHVGFVVDKMTLG
jgi:hypothetical protein